MRREAHYVATLMWEEGAGERWGGRGRDEGNGALEARRTVRKGFRGALFFQGRGVCLVLFVFLVEKRRKRRMDGWSQI